jgi:16S rRNA U516 pseudouridylate synthase RsuA-like enzyme
MKPTLGEKIYSKKGIKISSLESYENRERWKNKIKSLAGNHSSQRVLDIFVDEWRKKQIRKMFDNNKDGD